jgi:aspartate/methionine/tyrosine aminotransferase
LFFVCLALCSNVVGQLAVGLMTRPPKPGDASFEVYEQERDGILAGMKHRASLLREGLNQLEGVSCADIQGAMYAFPTITLPGKLYNY